MDKEAAVELMREMSEQMKCESDEAQKTKELLVELESIFQNY